MNTPKRRNRIYVFCTVLAASVLTIATGAAGQDSNADFIVKPTTDKILQWIKEDALLIVQNGNVFTFTEIKDGKGRSRGYVVSEAVKKGNRSAHDDVAKLREVDPLVLFHALSRPGEQIPEGLSRAYGPLKSDASQGWALSFLSNAGAAIFIDCIKATSFDEFKSMAMNISHPFRFFSQDDGPILKPEHWHDMTGLASGLSELTGIATNIRGFYFRVRICHLDPDSTVTPEIHVAYRLEGANYWIDFSPHPWINPPDSTDQGYYREVAMRWTPTSSQFDLPIPEQNEQELDWRLKVQYAFNNDNYWIAASWKNPQTTLTPN